MENKLVKTRLFKSTFPYLNKFKWQDYVKSLPSNCNQLQTKEAQQFSDLLQIKVPHLLVVQYSSIPSCANHYHPCILHAHSSTSKNKQKKNHLVPLQARSLVLVPAISITLKTNKQGQKYPDRRSPILMPKLTNPHGKQEKKWESPIPYCRKSPQFLNINNHHTENKMKKISFLQVGSQDSLQMVSATVSKKQQLQIQPYPLVFFFFLFHFPWISISPLRTA